jgi:ABC-type Fe3+/spermidine/putrescine transport system ATPase subunit
MNGALAGRVLAGRAAPTVTLAPGAAAHVAIRPEDIQVSSDDPGRRQANHLPGIVEALSFVGDRYEARVTLGGEYRIVLFLPRARDWREGERLQLGFPPAMVSVWPA